jgi:hypothetical protein
MDPMSTASTWNSLEAAKLAVAALTPLVVAFLGFLLARANNRAHELAMQKAKLAEQTEWANRRAVERLVELHREMAPVLNDIYCFFRLRGRFRDISPPKLIGLKRDLDRSFFANEQLFSDRLRATYKAFMKECFLEGATPASDALLKATLSRQVSERGGPDQWNRDWDRLFVPQEKLPANPSREQEVKYEEVMKAFAADLGLGRASPTREVGS